MSDHQYLMDYPLTGDVCEVEEWLTALAELIEREDYLGQHRADES